MSLNVGFANFPPWMYENGQVPGIERNPILKDFIKFYSQEFNATFLKMSSADFGKELPNGSWTGVIGMIQRQELDTVLQPFLPEASVLKAIDLSTPIYYTFTTILSGSRNIKATVDPTYIFNVFDSKVWLSILVSLIVVSSISAVGEILVQMITNPEVSFLHHLATQITRFWGFIFSEPFEHLPRSQSGRYLVMTWCLCVLILQYAYHGNLKSTFATISVDYIDTLEDLVKQPNIRLLMHGKSYYEQVLGTATMPLHRTLYKMANDKRGFVDLPELESSASLEEVASGQAAMILDRIPITYYLQNLKCTAQEFIFARYPVWFHPITISLGKHLPNEMKRKINLRFSMYATTKQMIPLLRQFEQQSDKCMQTGGTRDTLTMGLSRFTWSFTVYGIGIATSLVILMLEFLSKTLRI